jgi:hypothetical protein
MANTPKDKADETEETDTAGSYYYDDAHGYEEFKPDEEEDATSEEEREEEDEGADLSGGAFDVDLD